MTHKTIKYPDGQINVSIDSRLYNKSNVDVNMKIDSYEKLFELASLCETFKSNNITLDTLTIPCLFGQRSDRRFSENESFGLKIITDFINNLGFKKVKIFDPHSDVSLALINNSESISSLDMVIKTIDDICSNYEKDSIVLVSPDAGAYKKLFKYSEKLNLPLIAANKFRDKDGNITLNILGDVKGKNCIIIDDILDGGYTFHLLGEKLKQLGSNKNFLYVSHGYFNKGFNFTEYIDMFYTTNSVKEINDIPNVKQFKIFPNE